MAKLKKIASTAAFAASLGAAVLGVGAGIASAAPSIDPAVIPLDRGWGHGHDDWDGHGRGWGGPGWRGDGWDGPQVYVNLPCVTGPAGFVTVCP